MKTTARGVLALITLASACSPGIRAGADYAPGVNLGSFATFTWDEPDTRPVGDPRLENNPFFEARLHEAIERELNARGLREADSGAGLVVHHHATVRDHIEVYEADREAGYTTAEYGEGTRVLQYDEGTLLVDIANADTREVIWRGWAQFDISAALVNPEIMSKQIDEAVARIFEFFPGSP
jgi:hypothetical protein